MTNPRTTRLMAAGAIGNLLEWYDFAVYGYFAAAIGRAFFPEQDKVAQVLAAFGVFAVGFMMRPIGGAIFGHVGDRIGRSAALTLSVAAMAVPTFLIGVLPGYDVLGLAAPVLLTLLRMVQGLSVGGEYTTSIVFLVEHARPGAPRRGRRRRRPRRGVRHPAGLGDRRHPRMGDAGGGGGRLGLAHSVLDRPFRRRRRPGAAPRLR